MYAYTYIYMYMCARTYRHMIVHVNMYHAYTFISHRRLVATIFDDHLYYHFNIIIIIIIVITMIIFIQFLGCIELSMCLRKNTLELISKYRKIKNIHNEAEKAENTKIIEYLNELNGRLKMFLSVAFSVDMVSVQRVSFETSSGIILEKIAKGEAVHSVRTLNELKKRLRDGRRYAYINLIHIYRYIYVCIHTYICIFTYVYIYLNIFTHEIKKRLRDGRRYVYEYIYLFVCITISILHVCKVDRHIVIRIY
jgi:hypothetical protein